ncbi:hemolysin family protein [Acaricomes phytoseiuli]|uniref:hemolysin family protein n=1 Tax=Acaricomes phytoseiuli TaxID=291968 RepID=UPI00037CB3E7|nr:hemolysin family protein [Acaricomes phytoseiuli]MCW1249179.1 hemolysin family protein [Acaricomes phytoseiuli]
MSIILLAAMALLFIAMAAILTAADAALTYLPRQEVDRLRTEAAEEETSVSRPSRGRRRRAALRTVLDQPIQHDNALSFWRIWCEMAAAVAVTLVVYQMVQHTWLTGLVVTVVMAGVGFVLVGVSPRQVGREHPLRVALNTAWLVRLLCMILGPVPRGLVSLGRSVTPGRAGGSGFMSEEELRDFVDRASAAEAIEDEEAELIQSVFDLDETLVRAVMVPRPDIVSLTRGSSLRQALALFIRSGYSRIPVFGESSDEVLGVLYLKDVVAAQQRLAPGEEAPPVEQVFREVRYVPESKPVGELLRELQGESTHVAIVIDEYGGTAGLVTLEDLIEELVGEIVDEYDTEGPEVEDLGEGRYRVSARMNIADLGEIFDRDLIDDEVDTVGGLLAKILGRVPIVGSEAAVDGIVLRAERLEGRRNRVSHLIVSLAQSGATESESGDSRSAEVMIGVGEREHKDD